MSDPWWELIQSHQVVEGGLDVGLVLDHLLRGLVVMLGRFHMGSDAAVNGLDTAGFEVIPGEKLAEKSAYDDPARSILSRNSTNLPVQTSKGISPYAP